MNPSPDAARALNDLPVLYIKSGCPWCAEVVTFLDEHGVPYHEIDVTKDAAAEERMRALSGQARVPTFDWHGRVLADFGVEELVPFLRARNVKLEDS
jgi:glutaredoxin